MQVTVRLIAVTALLGLVPLGVAGAERNADPKTRQAVLEVDQRYREALVSHDEAALQGILTDDYRWVGNTGQMNDKAELLRLLPRWRWTVYERTDVRIYDLGSAVMMTADTNKNEKHAASVQLFRKENGRWRLAFLQTTPKPSACSPDNLFC